jgi:subtilisin family serine protease
MRHASQHKRSRRLAAVVLAVLLCLGILLSGLHGTQPRARAESGESGKQKVASDLHDRVNKSHAGDRVSVIVQPAGSWSGALDTTLRGAGANVKGSFKNFAAHSVEMNASDVEALAERDDVAYVSPDRDVQLLGHVSLTTGADAAAAMANYNPTYDGTGVGIAVLDSGVDPNHVAFDTRIVANVDFTGEGITSDPFGHGSHVTSIAAGNGKVSNGSYQGIAPNANIINVRVLNSQGTGTVSQLLSALDWVKTNKAKYNIRVVNMSLGTAAVDSYKNDPVCQAVRALVNSGVVVVCAAGNEGKDSSGNKVYGQIHSPGDEPSAITVGASNTFGTDARNDDQVTTYSSRGPTRGYYTDASGVKHYDNLVKPDLVAPGNKIIDAEAANNYLVAQYPALDANVSGNSAREQMYLSGTSMATPVVSGAAAMLLQANPNLTPNLVKAILMYTAQQLPGFNQFEQGAGEVNLEGAMRLARLVRTDLNSCSVGSPLLTSSAPTPQTTIAGYQFTWGQGLIMNYNFATGTNLITKYQGVYGLGKLLGDGVVLSNGTLMSSGTLLSDGVLMGGNIMTSSGVVMGDGSVFLSCNVLMGDGVLLSDGTLLSDGVLLGDGVVLGDGVLLGDMSALATSAMIYGDNTSSMRVVLDSSTAPAAPASLTATAYSKSQINLAWADKSTNESGFYVERSTDGVTFSQVATLAANSKSYSSTGLSAGKKYYYRVRAYNSGGTSAYTSVASATTPTK